MIELRSIRCQYLNGSNIVKQIALPDIKTLQNRKELEEFRHNLESQYQSDSDASGHDTRVSVVFDYVERP